MKEKRRIRKGVLSFVLAVIMIFGTLSGILPGTSIKVKAETATGEWSSGIKYSYDTATGVLTLTGNGSTTVGSSTVVIDNHSDPVQTNNEPFSNISKIVISEGITAIGDFAFDSWHIRNNITIEIPSTVTSIGNWAFSSITWGSVSVIMNARPGDITTFYTNAFNGSKNGKFITPYESEWKESDKCSYDSTDNKITFDNNYQGIFTLSAVTYTVTFKDYDGTILKTQENVEYNTSATAPDDPKREGYTFTGWDKEFTNITADTTITATYSINSYTVTWTNYDDTVLKADTVDYGETPEYTGDTPKKPADAQYTYTFVGWTPEIDTVIANVTYKATYKETEIKKDNGEKDVITDVRKDEKSPDVKVSNLTDEFAESTLTAEEQTLIEDALNNGDAVEVELYLSINDISDAIAAADKAKVETLAADADQLEYFDISLYKEITIGGVSQGVNPMQTLATPLKLTISVPKSFPAVASGYTRTYAVIRLHDGKAELLPATVNSDGTISFETDKFSTYALAYTDTKEASTSDATTASAKAEEKTSPKTGDTMPIAVLAVLMLSAAGAFAFMDLKKKKN